MNKTIYMILTNGFDPDIRVLKEAKYISTLGYNIEIICWDRKNKYNNNVEEVENIKIRRFSIPSVPGTGFKQIIPFFKFIHKTKKYLKDKDVQFLHCHDLDGLIVGYISTLFKKEKKLIFDMHEMYQHYKFGKFKSIFSFLVKKSTYIIYVNDEQIKDMQEKENLIYLPNYPVKANYTPIEKTTNNSQIRLNYIGFLRDQKSIDTLIKFGKENNNVTIGLYGTGVLYEKLKDQKLKNCKIYGEFNGEKDIGKIYQNTDILYCVYNPEIKNWRTCYPVKLYEAIITCTPVIVAEGTKAGELVKEKQIGECIKFEDIESLKTAVDKISQNYEKYVEKLALISNDYLWEEVNKNLDKIYKV